MKYPASSSILNSVSFTWVREEARWWFDHIWDGRLADQVNWIILLMVNTRQLLLPRGNRIHIYCTYFLSTACVYVLFASFCMAHCALDLAGSNVPQKCPFIGLLHAALYIYYALQCIYCNTIWDTTWLQCQTQFGCTVTWKPCRTKFFFINNCINNDMYLITWEFRDICLNGSANTAKSVWTHTHTHHYTVLVLFTVLSFIPFTILKFIKCWIMYLH